MKRPHLFRVSEPIETFASVVQLARQRGLRIGWLALREPLPMTELMRAAEAGLSQTVVAGARQTVAVRARRGPPVVDDLLRQYFLGCDAVLIQGEVTAPGLVSEGSAWSVKSPTGRPRHLDSEQFLASLRAPASEQRDS